MTKTDFMLIQKKRVLAIKISSEKPFKKELKSYFYKQSKKIKTGNTELIDIKPLLKKHYLRIVDKLTGIKLKQENDGIINQIEIFLLGLPLRQSNFINKTSSKDIEKSLTMARTVLSEQGISNPTNSVLSKVAGNIFRQLSKGRITNIAMTETQNVTEGLRLTIVKEAHNELYDTIIDQDKERAEELYELSQDYTSYKVFQDIGKLDNQMLFAMLATANKTWGTAGDKRVRPAHNEAEGQTVSIETPYEVDGELLMYPGDNSYGASLKNTSGCRCYSAY